MSPIEARRARARALLLWIAGAAAVVTPAGLAAHVLPWHLSDRLRCAAAFETTAGPSSQDLMDYRVTKPLGSIRPPEPVGRDPCGQPFLIVDDDPGPEVVFFSAASRTPVRAHAYSPGPDGVLANPPGAGDDVSLGQREPTLTFVRSLPLSSSFVALFAYLALTVAWITGGRDEGHVFPLLLLPVPATWIAAIAIADGLHAFQAAPPTTPLGGHLAPGLSVYMALVVASIALWLANRTRARDRARTPVSP